MEGRSFFWEAGAVALLRGRGAPAPRAARPTRPAAGCATRAGLSSSDSDGTRPPPGLASTPDAWLTCAEKGLRAPRRTIPNAGKWTRFSGSWDERSAQRRRPVSAPGGGGVPNESGCTWAPRARFGRALIVQFSSVAQSCPTLCDPMNRSTPGLPVHHLLPESTQTHVHRVSDAIQPSHPLSSPSPPAPNPSQHQSLFQ